MSVGTVSFVTVSAEHYILTRGIHAVYFCILSFAFIPCLGCRAALTPVVEVDSAKRVGLTGHAVLCGQHSNPQILIFGQDFRQGSLLCLARTS